MITAPGPGDLLAAAKAGCKEVSSVYLSSYSAFFIPKNVFR